MATLLVDGYSIVQARAWSSVATQEALPLLLWEGLDELSPDIDGTTATKIEQEGPLPVEPGRRLGPSAQDLIDHAGVELQPRVFRGERGQGIEAVERSETICDPLVEAIVPLGALVRRGGAQRHRAPVVGGRVHAHPDEVALPHETSRGLRWLEGM